MVYFRDFLSLLLKRAGGAILVSLGTITIIFLVSHVLAPNPAHLWAGPKAHAGTIAQVVKQYHLNDPLYLQYLYFLRDLFTGNLGVDPVTRQLVSSEILFYLPNTLELVIAAFAVLVVTGVGLGYLSGMHFSTKIDSAIRLVYVLSWSTPTYLGAIVAILLFATYLPIFPSGGLYSSAIPPPHAVTGVFIIDAFLTLDGPAILSGLRHLILPALVLAFLNFGIVARITRSSILNVRWSTHVKSARARGLPEAEVRRKHILRNALIDTTSVSAVMFGWLLTGTIIVEELFGWPGIGQFAYEAISSSDYPALIPIVIVFTLGVIVANFIADILYSVLDPRIALGGNSSASQ